MQAVRAMDVREFEDLVDRLGEDISRWPDAQREAAASLLSSSMEAAAVLAQARILREALAVPPVRAPAGLADRIFAAASRLKVEQPLVDGEAVVDATQSG
jgi:hypothetical protein